nr:immunoglobulin heavy chain junction region [Macaca mulatta]MOV90977.1 immunoglobulin heavy chain junction region [Macaca mulatta]MOV91285.1 immunoglobulin heavy chain junction region [Macaca mulatta]MOV91293.1 immunoglobulin heavy chain junction region [Macaca mulatta]MOV91302.1 immunoglobulin heavy chain junction region [Macaca mulatta]
CAKESFEEDHGYYYPFIFSLDVW